MDQTIWNDGVAVNQVELENEHTALEDNIVQRWLDGATMGVVDGLTVTVNTANATLVDLALGRGYTPSGLWAEILANATGLGLSSYANATLNYVCLVYTEATSRPEAHLLDGGTRNTKSARSARVRVFTATELGALTASSDDLSVDARDRTLVCGVVTAQGVGVPLTNANIVNAVVQTRLLSIVQPSIMTGVEAVSLAAATPTTLERTEAGDFVNQQASLRMTLNANPPTIWTLEYKAPGDAAFGAAVAVTAGGSFTLASGTTPALTLTVNVTTASLPRTHTSLTITEALNVIELYATTVQRGGARDEPLRRSLAGDVIPSIADPHGAKLRSLGAIQEVLQTLTLGSGLLGTLLGSLVPRLRSAMSSVGDKTLLWEIPIAGSTIAIRFYADILSTLDITVNARWHDNGAGTKLWKKDTAGNSTRLQVASSGLSFQADTSGGDFTEAAWSRTPMSINGVSSPQGLIDFFGRLRLGNNVYGTAAEAETARVETPYGTVTARTLIWYSASGSSDSVVRLYRVNGAGAAGTTNAWELTYNALWSNAGPTWAKDSPGAAAWKIEADSRAATFYHRFAASGGAWTDVDANWDGPRLRLNFLSGQVEIARTDASGGYYVSGVTGEYWWTSTRTFRKAVSGASGTSGNPSVTQVYDIAGTPITDRIVMVKLAGANAAFHWNIELPAGAVITQARLNLDNYNVAGDWIRFAIIRQAHLPTTAESLLSGVGYVDLIGASGVPTSTIFTPDQNATIDPTTYAYSAWLGMGSASTIGVSSIDITYTLNKVVLP